MRCMITSACLCMCLKHYRRAKKSMPCLIKKASWCAADCTSKTTTFYYLSLSIKHKDLTRKSVYLFVYFIGSVEKIVFKFSSHKGRQTWQIKRKNEWWNNHVLTSLLSALLTWNILLRLSFWHKIISCFKWKVYSFLSTLAFK